MASALLGPLCQRVINPVYEEYKLVNNVEEEIKKLGFTVSLIEGVLQDAEEKAAKKTAVGIWLISLKQVLYDAEDILDEVATDAALPTTEVDDTTSLIGKMAKVCHLICCFGSMHKFWNHRDIAHQIQAIRMRLDDISKEKDKLGLRVSCENNWPEASRPRRLDTSSMLVDESYIFGRDDEKKKVIQWLLECGGSKNSIHVLSIVGMGGVGKTTLTKLVLNDPIVTRHFQLRMWVCVSNDFDLKRIVQEIMDGISAYDNTKELCETSNWDATQKRLKDKVEGKRFLLVLDDVWEEDPYKWECLCEPLKYGGEGSKIIVTTRSQKVSDIVKGTPILLKGLSSEYLWSLFETYAFDGCDSNKHMQLATVGKQIVEKLKGSPLAAKTTGRLLNTNLDVMYWKHIMKSEISLLPQHESDIMPILKLSYNHLSGHLKQCFAYCSLFPKDHKFSKNKFVKLWMAQNFVQMTRAPLTESIGSVHFADLQYKSFFEQIGENKFVMHDLIHDLAELVSEDDCFKLEDNNHMGISETVRHVSIVTKNFDLVNLEELCKREKLRTLLFMSYCKFQLGPHLDNLFMKLQRLRVLGLSSCDIEELPTSIGTLKHLRFLDLSRNDISKLPESLCNLHNLQVFKLRDCKRLRTLPSNMSALINLRHLDADTRLVSSIQGLGKLTALQELSVSGRMVMELADMGILRKVQISELEEVQSKEEAIQARLDDKEHLDVLGLEWSYDREDHSINPRLDEEVLEGLQPADGIKDLTISNYGGAKSPNWMDDRSWVFSSFLETLELYNCTNWEVLPPLSQLRCLKKLEIKRMNKVRQIRPTFLGFCADGGRDKVKGFPSLEELKLYGMREWEEWEVPQGDDGEDDDQGQQQRQQQRPLPLFLPRLRILEIDECPMLRQLPPLPPTLTRLKIRNVGLARLPGWSPSSLSSSPSLSSLSIMDCPNLTSLSDGLLQLPLQNLESLEIEGCQDLVSLPKRAFGHLPSLKSFTMTNCPKLFWLPLVPVRDALPSSLTYVRIRDCGERGDLLLASAQKLTSLTYLQIQNFSKSMQDYGSLLPSSLEKLIIAEDDHLDDESLFTCLRGLTSLGYLSIFGCPVITSLPGAEALSHLRALRHLTITRLKELTSLGGIHALVSLEELEIEDCPKLLHPVVDAASPRSSPLSVWSLTICKSSPQQIKVWLLHCPSLRELKIHDCPQLTGFDGDGGGDIGRELEVALLNLAPSLRALVFSECENLRSLPPKLRRLSSLKELRIYYCRRIQSLPVAGLPESVESLDIYRCPALKERCQEEGGPDWPLISHIPRLRI